MLVMDIDMVTVAVRENVLVAQAETELLKEAEELILALAVMLTLPVDEEEA